MPTKTDPMATVKPPMEPPKYRGHKGRHPDETDEEWEYRCEHYNEQLRRRHPLAMGERLGCVWINNEEVIRVRMSRFWSIKQQRWDVVFQIERAFCTLEIKKLFPTEQWPWRASCPANGRNSIQFPAYYLARLMWLLWRLSRECKSLSWIFKRKEKPNNLEREVIDRKMTEPQDRRAGHGKGSDIPAEVLTDTTQFDHEAPETEKIGDKNAQ